MAVEIHPAPFTPYALLADWERQYMAPGSFGATASFVGTMRDFNEGDDVTGMTLEHYPGMTEKQLEDIVTSARDQWPLLDALIAHRVGDIAPGEPIVLTACWSAHRAAAFDACRYLMEALKSHAPFWKKESLKNDSTRWVARNTPG